MLRALADAVRAGRKARAWSRRDLADASGVSERFLAEIENARGNPSLLKLFDLAASLGTTPVGLLQDMPHPLAGRRVLALLGLRGAGKSSVGAEVAARLGLDFVELDRRIEEQSGMTLAEMFEIHGQTYYRRMERQALESLLDGGDPLVLSTGGGLVTEPATFELLKEHAATVWLKARPEDHWERVVAQGDMRPMAGHDEAFGHLCAILSERERLYEQAQVTVETSGRSLDEVCGELVELFADLRAA